MKRYFINLTRILTTKSDQDLTKNLNRLGAHIKRNGVKHFYMVAEVSPAGLRHIHSILILDTLEQKQQVLNDLKKSRLKAYIDDISEVSDNEVDIYYRYINKQFIKPEGKDIPKIERIRGVNYNFCEDKKLYDFDKLNLFWKKYYRNDIFVQD